MNPHWNRQLQRAQRRHALTSDRASSKRGRACLPTRRRWSSAQVGPPPSCRWPPGQGQRWAGGFSTEFKREL